MAMDKWLGLRLLTMGLLMGSSGAGADACAVLSWNASPGATALRLRGGRGAAPSSSGSVARAGAVGIRKRDRRKKLPSRQREKAAARKQSRIAKKMGASPGSVQSTDMHADAAGLACQEEDNSGEGSAVTHFEGSTPHVYGKPSSFAWDAHLGTKGAGSGGGVDVDGDSGIGHILNYVPTAGGNASIPDFGQFEDQAREAFEFDGVFDCEKVNASDPAVLHQFMKDLPVSLEQAYKALEVVIAIRGMEAKMARDNGRPLSEAETELLNFLQRKAQVLNCYMQHLYLYSLLKVTGEWFPEHRLASNLRELRMMLGHMQEEEKILGPQMVEVIRQVSAHASELEDRGELPRSSEADAEGGQKETALLQDQSHGRQDGQLPVSKQGKAEGVAKQPAADLSWAPPVPWTAGQEDDGLNRSGLDAVDYWQQLFWEAARLHDEIKAGRLAPTPPQEEFVANVALFESKWEAAFHARGGAEEQHSEQNTDARSEEASEKRADTDEENDHDPGNGDGGLGWTGMRMM